MKVVRYILLGVVIIIVLAAGGVFIYLQTQKPVYSGELKADGLKEEVEVLYDEYGVPHIYATNEEDAYLALGYVHAQDRLFQMEMLRRAAGGRLSEVLGADLLPVDKLFRTLGLNQFAARNAAKYLQSDSAAFQRAVHAYQKGVNAYVRTGKTPIEFTIIGIPKEEFTPEDIYLAVGFMSFGFAEGLQADPVLQQIRETLGDDYLTPLGLDLPTAVTIKSFDGQVRTPGAPLVAAIRKALDNLRVPLFQGSNGWVISGERTVSGYPLLANDTHIGFSQPAVWYEAHIEYPGFRFYGHHLAGIPFGLLGNNHRTGWGLTMFENDDTDFFVETLNPENVNQVKFKESWQDVQTRQEIIKVKGQADVVLDVRTTRHGPVMNDMIENVADSLHPIALSWILNTGTNRSIEAAYLLNHSRTLEETRYAASLFSAPGLNVMYGDIDGNIAWWAVAKLPIRPAHVKSKFFLDGASGKDEYLGYYPFSKNPHGVNPPEGYVYSANNQPDTVDGVLYPGYYYPKARAGRIVMLLDEKDKKWSGEDAKRMNLDVVSIMHPDVAHKLAGILSTFNKPEYNDMIALLSKWQGDHKQDDAAPTVYYNLLSQVMFSSMRDELGNTAFNSLMSTSIPKHAYLQFISDESSPWWDNVLTKDVKETRPLIIESSAIKTLAILRETCGSDVADWAWGKVHTLTHGHPLGSVKPLNKFFNVGPFAVDGGSEVLNNLSFSLDTTGYFPVTSGPALRKVTDFAAIENGETVSPTGQSGNVMSKFYDDQAEMFATGKVRGMLMNREAIEKSTSGTLLLKP